MHRARKKANQAPTAGSGDLSSLETLHLSETRGLEVDGKLYWGANTKLASAVLALGRKRPILGITW